MLVLGFLFLNKVQTFGEGTFLSLLFLELYILLGSGSLSKVRKQAICSDKGCTVE